MSARQLLGSSRLPKSAGAEGNRSGFGKASPTLLALVAFAALASAGALSARGLAGTSRRVALNIALQQYVSNNEYLDVDAPWPKYQHDWQNTGVGIGSGADGFVKWTFKTGGAINSSAVVDEQGTVYFGSNDGYLYAVRTNGSLKWAHRANLPIRSTPLLAKGVVFFATYGNKANAYALDTATGKELWQGFYNDGVPLHFPQADGPLAMSSSGFLYAGTNLVNCETGSANSSFYTAPFSTTLAVVPNRDLLYVNGGNPNPNEGGYGLDAYTLFGDGSWDSSLYTLGSPALGSNGSIYTTMGDGTVEAIRDDLNNGIASHLYSVLWTSEVLPNFVSQQSTTLAVGKDGTVYAVSGGSIVALDATTGATRWSYEPKSNVSSSVAIAADGTLYFRDHGGTLYALDPGTGGVKWTESLGSFDVNASNGSADPSPAIGADGTIFIGTQDGVMHAIGFNPIRDFFVSPVALVGGSETDGVVQLTYPTNGTGPRLVSLESSEPGILSVPESVAVANDATGVSFRMTSPHVTTGVRVTLTATLGSSAKSTTVYIDPYAFRGIFASPNEVTGGDTTDIVVQITGEAAVGDYTVFLSSSLPAVHLPVSLAIPLGEKGVSVRVKTSPVSAPTVATLTAKLGAFSQTTSLKLEPFELAHFFASPSSVSGGQWSDGVVQIAGPAGPQGNVVSLTSSDAAVTVPATITVPAGKTGASFRIKTEPAGTSARSVTLTAKFNGQSMQTTLTLRQ